LNPSILDFTQEELEKLFPPKFRAKQIYNWVYQHHIDDFMQMENIPKSLRLELAQTYRLSPLEIANKELTVESVLLKMKDEEYDEKGELIHHAKYTVCVSTQVGCKVGCAFCLTAKGGFVRNLTPGEIVGQVLEIKKDNNIASNRRVNIVYMGMGEPLDNLDNIDNRSGERVSRKH